MKSLENKHGVYLLHASNFIFSDSQPKNGLVLSASKWRRGTCLHPPFMEITIIYHYIQVLFDTGSDDQTPVLMLAQKTLYPLSNLSSSTREYLILYLLVPRGPNMNISGRMWKYEGLIDSLVSVRYSPFCKLSLNWPKNDPNNLTLITKLDFKNTLKKYRKGERQTSLKWEKYISRD